MKKIIFIIRSMAQLAGTEKIISNKMNYLSEKGYDITLITYEQGIHPISFELNNNIRVIDINTRFFLLSKLSFIQGIIQFLKLKYSFKKRLNRIIKDLHPDIICCTTYSLKIAGIIANSAQKFYVKSIIESHVAMDSILREYDNNNRNIKYYLRLVNREREIWKVQKFNELIVITKGDAKAWSKYKTSKIIPNFIDDTDYINIQNKTCLHRIICVGRLEKQKGYDLLIKAFSLICGKHYEWVIDIFGNGPEEETLIKTINNLGLNHHIRINHPSPKIYEEYKKSDFLVFSSRYEGFGLVLAEAMSCGIPCVSFDCDYGPSEIIDDGINGLLVKNGDIKELANKIEWMMTHEQERYNMGIKAYEKAKIYKMNPIMDKWIKLYDEICESQ